MVQVFSHRQVAWICDTQPAPDGTWELLIVTADGREILERFPNAAALNARHRALIQGAYQRGTLLGSGQVSPTTRGAGGPP